MSTNMLKNWLAGAVVVAAAGALAPAQAQPVTFDFESSTATYLVPPGGARPGALTNLSITQSGLTMTITREGAGRFDVLGNPGNSFNRPASWGTNSLDPFFSTAGTAMIAT